MTKVIKITEYINKSYQGGMDKFLKDHGAMCYIPFPVDLMYVIHPNLPKEIREGLYSMFGNSIFFGSEWNFSSFYEEHYDSVSEALGKALNKGGIGTVGVIVNPCVIAISITEIEKDDDRVSQLIDFMKTIPGLMRGCIVCSGGEYVTFEGTIKMPELDKSISPIKLNHPKRDVPISDDDISNLIIALNTSASVDDFIKTI